MLNTSSQFIWLDGSLLEYADARIDFLSPTLHYGLGIIAGMRCYNTDRGPAVLRLEAHLERFLQSIKALGVGEVRHTVDDLRVAVHQTITANGFVACYVRPIMYLRGSLGLDMSDAEPVIGIATWRWDDYWERDSAENGLRLMTSSYTRSQTITSSFPSRVSGHYVTSALAKTFAKKAGFDEAILLDPKGHVADCTGENLFAVLDGAIHTPTRFSRFGDVNRDSLIQLAADIDVPVLEENLSREQLYLADELFLCGTAGEVVHVCEVDHRAIGNGERGPITQQLHKLYFDNARGNGKHSVAWLNYVVAGDIA